MTDQPELIFEVEAQELAEALKATRPAISEELTRFYLHGTNLQLVEHSLGPDLPKWQALQVTSASSDIFIRKYIHATIKNDKPFSNWQGKTIRTETVDAILALHKSSEDKQFKVGVDTDAIDSAYLRLYLGKYHYLKTEVDGNFIDIARILDPILENKAFDIELLQKDLEPAIKEAKKLIPDDHKDRLNINFKIADGRLLMQGRNDKEFLGSATILKENLQLPNISFSVFNNRLEQAIKAIGKRVGFRLIGDKELGCVILQSSWGDTITAIRSHTW